jgi:hypothetical protein
MNMVASPQHIASAFFVLYGQHGDVTRYADELDISRQRVYRQAHAVVLAVDGSASRTQIEDLAAQVVALRQQVAEREQRLRQTVIADADRQAEFAALAQAEGVSLPVTQRLLRVFLAAQVPSVARLGRWTRRAGQRSAALLAVLDEVARGRCRQVAADEIFTGRKPILMMVEPDSLCWVGGRLAEHRDGETWAQEFGQLPVLEHVLRDAGTGLEKGLEQVNAARREQGQQPVHATLDHFHLQQEGRRALRRLRGQASRTLEQAARAQKEVARQDRRGLKKTGAATVASRRWKQAEAALDRWATAEASWEKLRPALGPFTPEGQFNTRTRAEAQVAAVLPQLQGPEWAKARRMLNRPELFTYLDRLHEHLEEVPAAADVKRALVRGEWLRRHPQRAEEAGLSAAAVRGILLVTATLLFTGGEAVRQAAAAVGGILRHTWRASSMVEGLNSVLRMHQARHRRLTQELLDLKRLYWNGRRLRTGKRRSSTPYQRLGLVLPDVRWWELLKIPPEHLRAQLSALNRPA